MTGGGFIAHVRTSNASIHMSSVRKGFVGTAERVFSFAGKHTGSRVGLVQCALMFMFIIMQLL